MAQTTYLALAGWARVAPEQETERPLQLSLPVALGARGHLSVQRRYKKGYTKGGRTRGILGSCTASLTRNIYSLSVTF